jgi:hypothetical protein
MERLATSLEQSRSSLANALASRERRALRMLCNAGAPLLAATTAAGNRFKVLAVAPPPAAGAEDEGSAADDVEEEVEDAEEAEEARHVEQVATGGISLLVELLQTAGASSSRALLQRVCGMEGGSLVSKVALPYMRMVLGRGKGVREAGWAGVRDAASLAATVCSRCRALRADLRDTALLQALTEAAVSRASGARIGLLIAAARLAINTDALADGGGRGNDDDGGEAAPTRSGPQMEGFSASGIRGLSDAASKDVFLSLVSPVKTRHSLHPSAVHDSGKAASQGDNDEDDHDDEDDDDRCLPDDWTPSPSQAALLQSMRRAVVALTDAEWTALQAALRTADPTEPVFAGCATFRRLAFAHTAVQRRVEQMTAQTLLADSATTEATDAPAAGTVSWPDPPSPADTISWPRHLTSRVPSKADLLPSTAAAPIAHQAPPIGHRSPPIAAASALPIGYASLPEATGSASVPQPIGSASVAQPIGSASVALPCGSARAPHHLAPLSAALAPLRSAGSTGSEASTGLVRGLVRPARELLDPFSGQAMLNPVETASGFVCDRESLIEWMLSRGGKPSSDGCSVVGPDPLTGRPCDSAGCAPREDLQARVEEWLILTRAR